MHFSLNVLFLVTTLISSVCAAPLSDSIEARSSVSTTSDGTIDARTNGQTIKLEVVYPSLAEGDAGRTAITGYNEKTDQKAQTMIKKILQNGHIVDGLGIPWDAKVEVEFKGTYPYKNFKEHPVGYYEIQNWKVPNQGNGKLIGTFGTRNGEMVGEIQVEKTEGGKKKTTSVAEYIA
ncbi:hypothetical protein GYMLUDRAFT_47029 [Collybiopsis luxurians FD-317 M1]|uniref:Uncharacterized protein n=1 Tax=Collybiopsis luxurians FD-317 M1 TaxID=944289 RepID=A0A0D0BNE9_9AGAR|nr:hypothetical protein GYMLUDRAFT_47029 [Collybiopsis luxurians FD-317 M1]